MSMHSCIYLKHFWLIWLIDWTADRNFFLSAFTDFNSSFTIFSSASSAVFYHSFLLLQHPDWCLVYYLAVLLLWFWFRYHGVFHCGTIVCIFCITVNDINSFILAEVSHINLFMSRAVKSGIFSFPFKVKLLILLAHKIPSNQNLNPRVDCSSLYI